MANDTDSIEKTAGRDIEPEIPNEEPPLTAVSESGAVLEGPEQKKPEGPPSEVVEFQDAAKSMEATAADAVPENAMFVQDDGPAIETSTPVRGNGRGGGRRGRFSNGGRMSVRDIVIDNLLERAHRAHPTLREKLRGTVLVKVDEGRERYLVDWRSDPIHVSETKEESADCVIQLQDRDLQSIASGSLNPQIAMLSEKISVEGNASFAMYFFNLIAPPAMH